MSPEVDGGQGGFDEIVRGEARGPMENSQEEEDGWESHGAGNVIEN